MPPIIRPAELTPKAKHLYKQVKNLKKVTNVYKIGNIALKTRLQSANKCFNYKHSGLSEETIWFCLQQLLRKRVKSKGQRLSLHEKLMCLALYKTSGPGYRLLSRWFQLPSRRTMARVLQMVGERLAGCHTCCISTF